MYIPARPHHRTLLLRPHATITPDVKCALFTLQGIAPCSGAVYYSTHSILGSQSLHQQQ